jgi:hypothetical protein
VSLLGISNIIYLKLHFLSFLPKFLLQLSHTGKTYSRFSMHHHSLIKLKSLTMPSRKWHPHHQYAIFSCAFFCVDFDGFTWTPLVPQIFHVCSHIGVFAPEDWLSLQLKNILPHHLHKFAQISYFQMCLMNHHIQNFHINLSKPHTFYSVLFFPHITSHPAKQTNYTMCI